MSAAPRAILAGFRGSTATAAHRIEGDNWNSDWWRWEHTAGVRSSASPTVPGDRATFARTPKESARWLGRVARAHALVD